MIIGKDARDLFKNLRNRYSRVRKGLKVRRLVEREVMKSRKLNSRVQNYLKFSGGLIHISSHARVNQIYMQPRDLKIIVMMIQRG